MKKLGNNVGNVKSDAVSESYTGESQGVGMMMVLDGVSVDMTKDTLTAKQGEEFLERMFNIAFNLDGNYWARESEEGKRLLRQRARDVFIKGSKKKNGLSMYVLNPEEVKGMNKEVLQYFHDYKYRKLSSADFINEYDYEQCKKLGANPIEIENCAWRVIGESIANKNIDHLKVGVGILVGEMSSKDKSWTRKTLKKFAGRSEVLEHCIRLIGNGCMNYAGNDLKKGHIARVHVEEAIKKAMKSHSFLRSQNYTPIGRDTEYFIELAATWTPWEDEPEDYLLTKFLVDKADEAAESHDDLVNIGNFIDNCGHYKLDSEVYFDEADRRFGKKKAS